MLESAERLWSLANYSGLFKDSSLETYLGRPIIGYQERYFSRSSFIFGFETELQEYWGSFWRGTAVPFPINLQLDSVDFVPKVAYTGIDKRVIEFLREKDFRGLLNFEPIPRQFKVFDSKGNIGVFISDEDGIINGWLSEQIDEIEFQV